jgi:hypothetical protein
MENNKKDWKEMLKQVLSEKGIYKPMPDEMKEKANEFVKETVFPTLEKLAKELNDY